MPDDLRAWAELHAPKGNVQAKQVLVLLQDVKAVELLNRCTAERVTELEAENERLRRGDFTPEEFQALCHHRDEKPGCTPADFFEGCHQYQQKLFGCSAVTALEAELVQARETIRQLQACVDAQEERMVESLPSRDAPVAP